MAYFIVTTVTTQCYKLSTTPLKLDYVGLIFVEAMASDSVVWFEEKYILKKIEDGRLQLQGFLIRVTLRRATAAFFL